MIDLLLKYMLTDENIQDWVFSKDDTIQNKKIHVPLPKKNENHVSFFHVPKYMNDTLFWCFYVIINGCDSISQEHFNSFKIENEFKYATVEKLREKSSALKSVKLKLQEIESELVTVKKINYSILQALAIAYDKSILVKCQDTYYDFPYGNEYHIIEKNTNHYFLHLKNIENVVETIKDTCYYINPKKTIKGIGSYSAPELQDIASKLKLNTLKDGKQLTKSNLYAIIVEKLNKIT
jgi:hypothetical protein